MSADDEPRSHANLFREFTESVVIHNLGAQIRHESFTLSRETLLQICTDDAAQQSVACILKFFVIGSLEW
jgi:hypothetical protein